MKTIKLGDKGNEVKTWQNFLKKEGYDVIVDGNFGPKTEEKTKLFQAANNLTVDGVVGPKTWSFTKTPQTTDLSAELEKDYINLWDRAVVNPSVIKSVDTIIETIKLNKERYEEVSIKLGGKIPWYFIAVIHNMESSLNFNKHLHNGDPLTARTKLVPAGRPKTGNPPFTWEESADDALRMKGYDKEENWTIVDILYRLEKFNGLGYRTYHPEVKSPYLWSGSNNYTKGKYIADGKWSDTAVSKQIGAATILKRMVDLI